MDSLLILLVLELPEPPGLARQPAFFDFLQQGIGIVIDAAQINIQRVAILTQDGVFRPGQQAWNLAR